jgi:hypothetical protein
VVARTAFLSSLFLAAILPPGTLCAQSLLHGSASGGPVQLIESDAAVLELNESRKDIPCTVTPVKPTLGFDLRFHAGYEITVPLRELAGEGDLLTVIFRVAPAAVKDSPVYFNQKFTVPSIDDDARGDAFLQGGFDIGEGDYHVDWLVRDKQERICSSSWDSSAVLPARDKETRLSINRNVVDASADDFFYKEPPVTRNSSEPLKVKVLINFAPQTSFASAMRPVDTSALVSILRNISREPRIGKFSIVAFNMNEQKVLYKNDDAEQIDFPELGQALSQAKFGMVDYKKLADKHSESDFLASLIGDELAHPDADAVIFAGPKIMLDDNIPQENLKDIAGLPCPVFYMNFNLSPQQNPWRDSIGNVVKKLRGYEYTITRPRDLWASWSDIMSRVVKLKLNAASVASSK